MAAEQDVFHHVRDSEYFELPGHNKLPLPEFDLFGYEFQLTKFMVLEVVAALIVFFIFWGLARQIRNGQPARGRFWNFWEAIALYIRDNMVRPTIGEEHHGTGAHDEDVPKHHRSDVPEHATHADFIGGGENISMRPHHAHAHPLAGHPADRYLPYVWSVFFFVLIANLLGMIPWLGSSTGNLTVTVVLALIAFAATLFAGIRKSGPIGFLAALCPSMDLSPGLKFALLPMIWTIEAISLLIKHGVLAIRLFANIMAGHTVLGVFLGFIAATASQGALWYAVTPASIFGQVAIGLLELLVAFIQAYVFAFLSTLFIASVIHEH